MNINTLLNQGTVNDVHDNSQVMVAAQGVQGLAQSSSAPAAGAAVAASPIHLSKVRGAKIDLIRVMNAWYELGMVTDACGGRLTKKEFFTFIGQTFNLDLSSYDKDLSNSMATGVTMDKQTRIFDELRRKHEEIYNSK